MSVCQLVVSQRGPGVVLQVSGFIPGGRSPEFSGMFRGWTEYKTTRVGRPEWFYTLSGRGTFRNMPDFPHQYKTTYL